MKKLILTTIASVFGILLMAQTYRGSERKSATDILNEEYCTGLFKTTHGTILDLTENNTAVGYINILDWLPGRVAGVQVYTLSNGVRIPFIRGNQASIFLDEVPVSAGFINGISVYDIAMIKVIKGPFAGAIGNGWGGVIAIYTFRGDEETEE